jgi:hypothetical protein
VVLLKGTFSNLQLPFTFSRYLSTTASPCDLLNRPHSFPSFSSSYAPSLWSTKTAAVSVLLAHFIPSFLTTQRSSLKPSNQNIFPTSHVDVKPRDRFPVLRALSSKSSQDLVLFAFLFLVLLFSDGTFRYSPVETTKATVQQLRPTVFPVRPTLTTGFCYLFNHTWSSFST